MSHAPIPRTLPALLILLAVASPAAEPALATAEDASSPGALTAVGEDGDVTELPLRHTRVTIEVAAFVARARVEHVFVNPFDRPIEVVYTFPLGHDSAVDEFELQSGDRVIRGEIRRRHEARETYEAARDAGQQAALLEQQRADVFTQSVANLPPAGEVRVRIGTVELLDHDAGTYQLTFPLVVGPRYVPGDLTEEDAVVSGPPVLPPGVRSGHDVEIEVTLDTGVPVASLASASHAIETDEAAPGRVRVRLSPSDRIPNKDFVLRWSVAADEPQVGLLAHREGVDGYLAFIVQPRAEVPAELAAPKEILFVLDTSGSMSGLPLNSSKRFIRQALASLGRRDRFNMIRFASGSAVFSGTSLDGSPENVAAATAWIDGLEGGGGTEMLQGLERAVAQPAGEHFRMIVFLTDGLIGDNDRILSRIARLPDDVRIFTVGIGSSINHSLLEGMARLGGGAFTFIPGTSDPEAALERFTGWVTRPYLTDISIDWGALPVGDWVPEVPRDLFSGQALTVIGRYHGAAEGEVVVRGLLAGRPWETVVPVSLPDREPQRAALASVWARGRIQELLDGAPGDIDQEVEDEIVELALEYRLMSPYTSFVAVDRRVPRQAVRPPAIVQPVPLPDGTSPGDAVATMMESVRVTALAAVVDLETAASSTRFSEDFIADLPVPGRFYQNVVAMAPGVLDADGDGRYNVHGSRARDFRAVVGDVRNVDPLVAGLTSQAGPSPVEDLEVISAGAGVEFGRAQGGFARVIQAQGSNTHEYSIELEAGSDAFDALGEPGAPVSYGGLRAGFRLTGPLVRDSLWYSATHEWFDRSEPVVAGQAVFAVPQAGAAHTDRLTWQVSPRNKLSFRGQWQTDDVGLVGISSLSRPEATSRLDRSERILSVTWTAPYSPRVLFNTVVSRRDTALERTPFAGPEPNGCLADPLLGSVACLDLVAGARTGSLGRAVSRDRRRDGVSSDLTIYAGRAWGMNHRLKAGVDAGLERQDQWLARAPDLVRFEGRAGEVVLARTSATPLSPSSVEGRHWSAYLEDRMKSSQRVAITVGLRVDGERIEGQGFTPFDPAAELERFLAAAEGVSGDRRLALAGETFTGPEDFLAFLDGVATRLGEAHCCGPPAIAPGLIVAPREPERLRLDDVNLSPFLAVKWTPWTNGRAAFAFTARRYVDRLLPLDAVVESEPATADAIVSGADGPSLVRPSVRVIARGLQAPYQDEWSLAFEREIFTETRLGVSLVRRRFHRQLQYVELNHRPADLARCATGTGGAGALDIGAGTDGLLDDCDADGRPDLYVQNPLWGDVFLAGNFGRASYEGLTLALERRQYRSWELQASYTLSEARGSAEEFGAAPGDEAALLENRAGLQSWDQRHAFKVHGTWITAWGVRFGGSVSWESGVAHASLDHIVVHDAVPPGLEGLTRGVPLARLVYATAERNQERNDSFFNLDLRVVKELSVGAGVSTRWRLDVLNVLDDRSARLLPGDRTYGYRIDGFDAATSRFGRRLRIGLDVQF